MSSPFSADVRKHSTILLLRNLPTDATAEQLSEWLWTRIGWNVPPELVSIMRSVSNPSTRNAHIVISRFSLADFFERALGGQDFNGHQIQVLPPKPKQEQVSP